MKLRSLYEVPICYMIAITVGFIVLNSEPVQNAMKKAIRDEYRKTGKIHISAWWLYPVYCTKLKMGKIKCA